MGFSQVTVTLKSDADNKDVLSKVQNGVNRVRLPTDANDSIITEIETDTNRIFSVFIYHKKNKASRATLTKKAIELKGHLERLNSIERADVSLSRWDGNSTVSVGGGGNDALYDIEIIIPKEQFDALGISLDALARTIRDYNVDQPIGNFAIGEKKYDYRIEGKNTKSLDFLKIPIPLSNGNSLQLWDIAHIQRRYKNQSVSNIVLWWNNTSYWFVGLNISKADSESIFTASENAKNEIKRIFQTSEFKEFAFIYGNDIADIILDDYSSLFKEALTTLLLVFVAMYLFIGFKDSLFATIMLPLSFLATFLMLYFIGNSLNFLTNFSFILSFGIAIDTIIVIVQAASAKVRIWYHPRTAIMLALKEYAVPIIAGVSTTIVVFVPMMVLPGIMGKFLANIPITIFGVLAFWLILVLTVNNALYLLFVKEKKEYVDEPSMQEYMTPEEQELLAFERKDKQKMDTWVTPFRIKIIQKITHWYKSVLYRFLENALLRRISILLPVIFFIFSIIFLSPIVGFELMPASDNSMINFTIKWPVGIKTEIMQRSIWDISAHFYQYPEIRYTSIHINNNVANITVQLLKKWERSSQWLMDVFSLEKKLTKQLSSLEAKWLKVTWSADNNWPPWWKAVWIKLIAEDVKNLELLIGVSKDFQDFLKTIPGTKNVDSSSQDTPWQFIFSLKKDQLANRGIPPSIIRSHLSQTMNGINIWTIEDNGDDMDIVLKTDAFLSGALTEDILSIQFTFWGQKYRIGEFINLQIQNSIAQVKRENGDIQITVDADLDAGMDTSRVQSQFQDFAKKYSFPNWISYSAGWENAENQDLIIAVFSAFFLAIIVIFGILTLQFNSFSQPIIILYSVIMALPFVIVGLLLTDNRFSMPFGIGFIAFTGIAVNHGIILISAINENLEKGMKGIKALVEAGSSRLEPMTLTTFTTVLGMIPIAIKDKFWSGMGFTIIFGIIATTLLTLFVLKGIYYEVYINNTPWFFRKMINFIKNVRKKRRKKHV